ncbi:MAG: hypothetical protein MUF42_13330 [Cytophagaceae bacterium]|jgi:hypothetical protein|nr:hypothetical protein [Cytophagaceae bacterium]
MENSEIQTSEDSFVKQTFTKEKILDFVVNELLGKFVGFLVGLWTTSWFSYTVYEKKKLSNLFGLMPRKKVVVNATPEWLQWIICALMGFLVFELIRYFFKNKLYLKIWNWASKKISAS